MDNRNFQHSFSVRIGTKRARFQLSAAEDHGGPEGAYRVRVDRCWLDAPDGSHRYFYREALAGLIAEVALDGLVATPPAPELPVSSRVSVHHWIDGLPQCWGTRTNSAPILDASGRWVVNVSDLAGNRIFVPVDDVTVHPDHRRQSDDDDAM
ncbi:hypothetical protein [Desulfovibrio falkowii]|uniref:hypothetical protein n=1 Tax=Desulfovibrio falkowii TaxID=3136602 RepID=UPI0038B288BE